MVTKISFYFGYQLDYVVTSDMGPYPSLLTHVGFDLFLIFVHAFALVFFFVAFFEGSPFCTYFMSRNDIYTIIL